jgi:cell division protein ZapA (FtsZ GTPase activity inhibitor)
MSDLIPVNIVIADRTYRIKTRASDEEVIRKTVKLINDKVIEFKTQFAGKDMQDYISMVIIWYATQNATGGINEVDLQETKNAVLQLENLLDKTIAPKE